MAQLSNCSRYWTTKKYWRLDQQAFPITSATRASIICKVERDGQWTRERFLFHCCIDIHTLHTYFFWKSLLKEHSCIGAYYAFVIINMLSIYNFSSKWFIVLLSLLLVLVSRDRYKVTKLTHSNSHFHSITY